jgi:hypothetical protein
MSGKRHPAFPPAPVLGDVGYYIQRGASLQTYRLLPQLVYPVPIAAQAIAADTLVAVPFVIGLSAVLDRIAFNVTVLGAGSNARAGIYRATSPRNVYPSGLVVDGGSISTATTGWKEANITTPLRPGLYWAAYLCSATAPSVNASGSSATIAMQPLLGWTNTALPFNSLRVAQAFGALPATFPGGAALNASHGAAVWGRFAA